MGNSVKFILTLALFILSIGINEATAKANSCIGNSHHLKSDTKSSTFNQSKSTFGFQGSKVFSLSDIERTNTSNTTLSESNSFRYRRFQETTIDIKSIVLQISFLDGLFTLDQNRIFHSDRSPEYAQTTCEYYIFALRRILI